MQAFRSPPYDPFVLYSEWHEEIKKNNPIEANTMAVATVNYLGQPSLRMMMLYMIYNHSFVFFTNMESRKALEIIDNPNVALCFNWSSTKQQVRIEGTAFKVPGELSDKAFQARPLEHQMNIVASEQSRHLEDVSILEQRVAKVALEYGDEPIKRPANWGGFAVSPSRIEFWEEKPFWMHERIVYTDYQGEWSISRLYP
ncbi:MAG: pyridoxamine 5'-phosphate oxidase [Proteobacteria bacterium]|nr:pyridoxamine 5'-phosphate oxidase [Pseudomonadota bacterium]